MLCKQSLKVSRNNPEAYSALSVIYAINENYSAADEMIRTADNLIKGDPMNNKKLFTHIKLNEAAIALLKNEKERAYILLRSVLAADNDEKAYQLYNRYFKK